MKPCRGMVEEVRVEEVVLKVVVAAAGMPLDGARVRVERRHTRLPPCLNLTEYHIALCRCDGTRITPVISATRIDAHPANAHPATDCLHYCMPGVPDVWTHALFHLLATKPLN